MSARHAARAARTALALVGLLAGAACTPAPRAPAPPSVDTSASASPGALLAGAIAHAGGTEALTRASALVWEGDATVYAGGRIVRIAGTWSVQPPDTAVVATYDVARGPESMRTLVLAAPRAWVVRDGQFSPMPAPLLANERESFYLYDVMRLVSLFEPGVLLSSVARDSLGQRGFRASRPGRPTVDLFVNAQGGLAHLRLVVSDPAGGAPRRQDVWLGGRIDADGVRWPRAMRITLDDQLYFVLQLRSLQVQPRVVDTLLAGPR